MNTKGNMLEKSEILEPLHTCLKEVLDKEKAGGLNIEYTDEDVIAATLMFSHVLGNRMIHLYTDERASIGLSQHLAATFGEQIQIITKQMTKVDISLIYKGGNK